MKFTKRIIIRIIVAVAVAVILSKLKLLGIMKVNALEYYRQPANTVSYYINSHNSSQAQTDNVNTYSILGSTYYGYQYHNEALVQNVSFNYQSATNLNLKVFKANFSIFHNFALDGVNPLRVYVRDSLGNISTCNVSSSTSFNDLTNLSVRIYDNTGTSYPVDYDGNLSPTYIPKISYLSTVSCDTTILYNNFSVNIIGPFNNKNNIIAISTLQLTRDNNQEQLLNNILQQQQQQTQAQTETKNNTKETNDLIKSDDTSVADSKGADFFNNFDNNSHGLSGVITAPLSFIQSLTSKSCTPLHLDIGLVDKEFDLPCATTLMQQNFPSVLEFYQTITFGVISYLILIKIFGIVKDAKNPDSDKIEVLDL